MPSPAASPLEARRRRPRTGALLASTLLGIAALACGPSRGEVKAQKEQAKYHYNLAYGHYFDTKNPNADAALQEVLASLQLDDTDPEAHMLAGLVYLGRQGYLDAERHFRRAIELEPDHFKAHNNLGATYLAMERWDDAIGVFAPLVRQQRYTTPGIGQNNLGWAHYKKGDRTAAIQHFKTAISIAPDLCPPYNNLGLAYMEDGLLEKAVRYLERGLKRCPRYAEPHFHLARVYGRQGDVAAARAALVRCMELAGETDLADRCERQLRALPPGPALGGRQ